MFRIHVLISGEVQGVLFRKSTKEKATQIGVMGWVKHFFSNAIEIKAEGSMEDLGKLLDWLSDGPEGAQIDKVSVEWGPAKDEFQSFEISE